MTYDPIAYWTARGREYEARFDAPAFAVQEQALLDVLHPLAYRSVLEVGCGFGRIGALLGEVEYTGIDLSADLLASAARRLPGATLLRSSLADFDPAGRRFDLVIAVEMLMHVPPDQVASAVRKLLRLSARHVVTLDWTTPLPRKRTAGHNFLHDYPTLFATTSMPPGRLRSVEATPVGLQTIFHVRKGGS